MSDKISNNQEQLARFAKAMGHPTRIVILHFSLSVIPVISAIYMKNCR